EPRRLRLGARQLEAERRAGAWERAQAETSAHSLGELPRDVEAETRSSRRAPQLRIAAIELLEDPLLFHNRDAAAAVGDADPHDAIRLVDVHADRRAAVLDRV